MTLDELTTALSAKLQEWAETAVAMVPNLIAAILVIVIASLASRLARRVTARTLGRVLKNRQITDLLATGVRVGVLLAGVFYALGILELDGTVTSLLAGVGIVGLALGFAFQDIAANFMAGVLMAVRRPFHIGDVVRTNDFLGVVRLVNLRATVLERLSGEMIILPNKDVFGNPIENLSRNGRRRVDLQVGVSYGDDLEKARRVAVEAVQGVEGRLVERDVELFYSGFGESSIDFEIRFWVPYRKHTDWLGARSEAVMRIKAAFDREGVTIPFPIRTLDFGEVGGRRIDQALPQLTSNRP